MSRSCLSAYKQFHHCSRTDSRHIAHLTLKTKMRMQWRGHSEKTRMLRNHGISHMASVIGSFGHEYHHACTCILLIVSTYKVLFCLKLGRFEDSVELRHNSSSRYCSLCMWLMLTKFHTQVNITFRRKTAPVAIIPILFRFQYSLRKLLINRLHVSCWIIEKNLKIILF